MTGHRAGSARLHVPEVEPGLTRRRWDALVSACGSPFSEPPPRPPAWSLWLVETSPALIRIAADNKTPMSSAEWNGLWRPVCMAQAPKRSPTRGCVGLLWQHVMRDPARRAGGDTALHCPAPSPTPNPGCRGLDPATPEWGRTGRRARAVRKVGCLPPPVATGPRDLNSAPPTLC